MKYESIWLYDGADFYTRIATSYAVLASLIGVGLWIDSPALQWAGAGMWFIGVFAMASAQIQNTLRSPQQAADYLHVKYGVAAGIPSEELDRLRFALVNARGQFNFYAQEHRKKQTPDGDKKAKTNEHFAAMCDEALSPNSARRL